MRGQGPGSEQLAEVANAIELIDEALDRIKLQDLPTAVLLMRHGREILDAIRTGRGSQDN